MSLEVKRCISRVALGALLAPLLLDAQSILRPLEGEIPVEALRGAQLQPSLAMGSSGGFLVWEDNAIDGRGQGIGLRVVSTDLQAQGPALLVNSAVAGEQEKPKVAILPDGTGVIVWQSNPKGKESDIYLRMVRPSGSFIGRDLRVNTTTRNLQQDPTVAILSDNSIVVAWSSYGQDGSMEGVFGRKLTAAGRPSGGEFRLNATGLYNQRTPAIAPLTGGTFVAVWVSEYFNYRESMANVYGRIFRSDGRPLGNEFLVNEDVQSVCANPSVAATGEDGFSVVYSKNNGPYFEDRLVNGLVQRVMVSPNDLDIYARRFGSTGTAQGSETRINSVNFGDQYGPKVFSVGSSQFVVWNSLGNDGSREAVVGRMLMFNGVPAGEDFRVNTTTYNQQFFPAVTGDGNGNYLVVWSGFTQTGTSFDLFSQRYGSAVVEASIQKLPDSLELSWSSLVGRRYKVQSSTDLIHWNDLPGNYQAFTHRNSIRVPGASAAAFYRVVELP